MSQIPFIADSVIPSTPLDPIPNQAAGESTLSVVSPADSSTDPAAAPSPPVDEIAHLSALVGADLSGFSSPADAQIAAKLIAERYALAGLAPRPQQQQQAPVQQYSPPVEEPEDEDGATDESLDPAVAKRLKALEREVQKSKAEAEQFRQGVAQHQHQALQAQHQELNNRANGSIDKLASPKYGVGGQQTFQQQIARQSLMRVADSVIAGMESYGQPLPTIEKIIELAVFLDGGAPVRAAAAPKVVDPLAGAKAILHRSAVPAATDGAVRRRPLSGNEADAFRDDAAFMQGARSILSRNR